MIGLTTVFCASLALARFHLLFGAAVMIAYVVGVARFMRDTPIKRGLVWGAVGGACSFVFVGSIVAEARGELPVTYFSADDASVYMFTTQYSIPVGGFIGALIGWIYSSIRTSQKERISNVQEAFAE